jgi:hypothetical protein
VARHDTGLTFIVNDYKPRVKSGYSLTDIIRGSLSQMPIYLESARVWFGDRGIEAKPWGAVYRSFGVDLHSIDEPQNRMVMKEPAFEIPKGSAGVIVPGWKGETKTFAEQSLATQIEQSLRALCNVIDNMSAGIYPVLPSGTACQRCDFLELCRVHEWGEHE